MRRQFPNNNIVIGELPTIADSQESLKEISVMAISLSTPKTPNAPSPNSKPSNKPSAPPKNAIQWQKGMSAMYQGTDWVIGMLGTATAKIVRNGFELWVDIVYLEYA